MRLAVFEKKDAPSKGGPLWDGAMFSADAVQLLASYWGGFVLVTYTLAEFSALGVLANHRLNDPVAFYFIMISLAVGWSGFALQFSIRQASHRNRIVRTYALASLIGGHVLVVAVAVGFSMAVLRA